MKRLALSFFVALAFAACSNGGGGGTSGGTSSGGASGGGSSGGGSGGSTGGAGGAIDVTLTLGIHPAALAAADAGLLPFPLPSLSDGYQVLLQGVSLKGGGAKITGLGSVTLTSSNDTSPITFNDIASAVPDGGSLGSAASLGLISAVVPVSGSAAAGLSGFPTCDQLYGKAALDGGVDGGPAFQDYFVTAGAQVYFGLPKASIPDGVALALPAQYVALLDCAAGITPGSSTDFLNSGAALLYVSQQAAAQGGAVSGITFSGPQTFTYFPDATYAAGSANASGPTGSAGVAMDQGVSLPQPVTPNGCTPACTQRTLATPAGSIYQVVYAPGT